MSDVIGRGVIEVSADSSKLNAAISDARKSIATLGDSTKNATAKSTASIDRYVKQLQVQQAVTGKTARETALYKLALRGASDEQLRAANTALKLTEAYERGVLIGERVKTGMLAIGVAAATGLIAAHVAFEKLLGQASEFQDLAEKTGDTAENIASLAVAAGTAGTQMETIVSASQKLTKGLTGVDDESKAAGAALTALGIDIENFKNLKPADQFEEVGRALNGFADGTEKTAVAMALFGKSGAELLPFLKEIGAEGGRQVILTEQQIRQADEYKDRQAKLRAEISLHAQAIASEMLPAYVDLTAAFKDTIIQLAGLESGAKGLANDTSIADFAESAVKSLAFVVDAVDGVIRVFRAMGIAIGSGLAVQTELIKHNFTAARNIAAEARTEIDKIFSAPTLGQNLEARIRDRKAAAEAAASLPINEGLSGAPGRQKLSFDGAAPKKKGDQEAKAQLSYDLDQIKKQSEEVINTFSNAEKIMQARRSAGLIDEKQYYAEKLNFLKQNGAEQERALQQEIARLQSEKAIGKEKIDNDRQIGEAQSKLAKVRADTSTNITIIAIQQEAANKKVAASYLTARQAAESYFDTVQKQQERELASIGKGAKQRNLNAGISQIEDRYSNQRRDLENQRAQLELEGKFTAEAEDQYKRRLEIIDEFQKKSIESYSDYYDKLSQKQGDWALGATEALRNYYDESQNIAKQTEDLFTSAFKGMEDSLVDFVTTGKLDFKSLADSIIADIARIVIKQNITGPLAKSFGGMFDGPDFSGVSLGSLAGGFGALENPFSIFGFANGGSPPVGVPSLVGERGPELFIPKSAGTVVPHEMLGGLGGIQITSAPVINIDSRADSGAVKADVMKAVQAGNAQLVDTLTRSGRLR